MDKRTAHLALGAAGIGMVWFLVIRGKGSSVTFPDRAFNQEYSPYQHYLHASPAGWVRHYPNRAAPTCLPMPYQNQDAGLSVVRAEVSADYGATACAQ